MALRNVVVEGDDILRKKARPVDEVNDRIRGILDDMLETMHYHQGVGIAAPQVGILRRMFIVEPEPGDIIMLVNPVLEEAKGEQESEEGCLSIPGYAGKVKRPEYVRFSGLNEKGEPVTIEAEGFKAITLSHEYDHLEGVLYSDKADDMWELDDSEGEEAEE